MADVPVRIAIADDHTIFRAGLRRLLETDAGCDVVGEAADGAGAVELVERHRPDLLLLDYAMPGACGVEALRQLAQRSLQVRTVILTADIEPTQVVEVLKLGAAGVLLKSAATDLLFKCIRAVMDGQYWVDRGTTGDVVSALQRYELERTGQYPVVEALTLREREIVAALVKGASNKQIARELNIAEQTVKNHLSQLYERLGVTSRLGLAVYARERDLL